MPLGEISCIFFSEFHPTAGPKIVYQVPENYISKDEFDTVHVYIITKPQLKDRIITIDVLGHKIVGCPVYIENPKYDRNKLIFNLCFVFDCQTNTLRYESVVKKLAGYLTTLENESGFLSSEETKKQLPEILTKILEELNRCGVCLIPIDQSTAIHLKVTGDHLDPGQVHNHDVPIYEPRAKYDISKWDMATQQYSNVYVTTPDINSLLEDKQLQEECLNYISRPGQTANLHHVLTLYCGLTAGTTVKDICARHNPHCYGIDVRKLIQFGLMRGLIRHLQKYPVRVPNDDSVGNLRNFYKWFNGNHCYDEICCLTGLSQQELDDIVENDSNIVICWK
ncbi:hypothetical protein LSH36_903g00084 [Paralvinella palmiformis]|uniref:Nitrogen permease regulator 2-like protein n=1 Tax=Paralvinella palmiformis TaxID=53620 RepID=A0AAD9IYE9_9ANNE|nr:hypothetical protein LSH36_903g00084 [Paralvinella palmiformis]